VLLLPLLLLRVVHKMRFRVSAGAGGGGAGERGSVQWAGLNSGSEDQTSSHIGRTPQHARLLGVVRYNGGYRVKMGEGWENRNIPARYLCLLCALLIPNSHNTHYLILRTPSSPDKHLTTEYLPTLRHAKIQQPNQYLSRPKAKQRESKKGMQTCHKAS
jgi:hypothetical protein